MAFTHNILTQKLGINFPIIQAPMAGGATTPELVAAVSNYGGLGSLGAGYLEPQDIKNAIKKIKQLTTKPFAVNLFIPENYTVVDSNIKEMQQILLTFGSKIGLDAVDYTEPYTPNYKEQLTVIIEEQVPIFSFTFGIPNSAEIALLKQNNITLIGTATNVMEAITLETSGIDIIVAQGCEAGGHRGTFLHDNRSQIGLMALIPQIVSNVNIPVIAAGGIMSSSGIEASLLLGANGVSLGTAFLTTHESGIHPKYKEILLNTRSDSTVFTKSFSGRMARGIKNEFIVHMEKYTSKILPYPVQNKLTQGLRKKAAALNNTEFMSLWAGQSAWLCKSISAHDLMQRLCVNNLN